LTKKYASNEHTMKLLQKASFLDPRHRNKYLGDQNQIGVIHDKIKLEMEQISSSDHSLKKNHQYTGKNWLKLLIHIKFECYVKIIYNYETFKIYIYILFLINFNKY